MDTRWAVAWDTAARASASCRINRGTALRAREQANPTAQLRPLKFRVAGQFRDIPLPLSFPGRALNRCRYLRAIGLFQSSNWTSRSTLGRRHGTAGQL